MLLCWATWRRAMRRMYVHVDGTVARVLNADPELVVRLEDLANPR